MKDKTYRVLCAFLILILGALSIGLALGWTTPLNYLDAFLRGANERWVLGIIGLFSAFVGLSILKKNFKTVAPAQADVVVTDLGQIKISLNALENMAAKVAKQVNGVKETKAVIKCVPSGIAIFVQVNLAPDINIPETTKDLQMKIKSYFSSVAGIEVEEVRILVTKMTNDMKGRVE